MFGTTTKLLTGLFITSTIVGCGSGGGSSSSTVDFDTTTPPSANNIVTPLDVSQKSFTLERQAEQPITFDNAEAIALDTVRIINHLIKRTDEFSIIPASVDSISFDDDATIETSYIVDCVDGGREEFDIFAPAQVFFNGYRVYGPGDRVTKTYELCNSKYTNENTVINGQTSFNILKGVHNGFDSYEPETIIRTRIHELSVSTDTELYSYSDGNLFSTITDTSFTLETDFFAILDTKMTHDVSFIISDYSGTTTDRDSALPSVNDIVFNVESPFILESGITQQKVVVAITAPVVDDRLYFSGLVEGEMLIGGSEGTLKVTIFKDYIEYQIDIDDDGLYEDSVIITDLVF